MVGKLYKTINRKIIPRYQWGPGHTADVVRFDNRLFIVHKRNGKYYINFGL